MINKKLLKEEKKLIDEIDQGYWKFYFSTTTLGKPKLVDENVYKKLQQVEINIGRLLFPWQTSYANWKNKRGFILPESYIKNVQNALNQGRNVPIIAIKSCSILKKKLDILKFLNNLAINKIT